MSSSQVSIRGSRIMAWAATFAAVAFPLAVMATAIDPQQFASLNLRLDHMGAPPLMAAAGGLPLESRLLILALKLVPVSIAVWGFISARRLFLLYAQGDVFSPVALKSLRAVGVAILSYAIVDFFMELPISAARSWFNPEGERAATLSLGFNDFLMIFIACASFVITRVMSEARRLSEENASFV